MERVLDKIVDGASDLGINLIGAIIIILLGFKIVNVLLKLLDKGRGFNRLDKSVQTFIKSLINISLKVLVLITSFAHIGVPMTSMITLFGSATLAVGLAIQGGLKNMVGGILILIFKPFKIGDFIDNKNVSGTVESITIFYTTINTIDNTKIVIPNGPLADETIINYSTNEERRVDLDFSVSYNNDVDKVKEVLRDVIEKEEYVNKEKEIFVRLTKHEDSALIYTVRVWTEASKYWDLRFNLLENVKKRFDKEKIEIPYNQMDVHIKNS